MTFAQARLEVLVILRKSRKLFGYKLSDLNPGYIYCPYIPLMMSSMLPENLEETRRQLWEESRRVQDHIDASRNVDLTVS